MARSTNMHIQSDLLKKPGLITILLLLLFFIPRNGRAIHIDSIKVRIENASTDSAKARWLIELGKAYHNTYDKSLPVYERALKLTKRAGSRRDHALALNNIAITYAIHGDIDSASYFFNQAYNHFEKIDDSHGLAQTLLNLGNLEYIKKDLYKAITYYQRALDVSLKHDFPSNLSHIYTGLGSIYTDLGDQESALDYYSKAENVLRGQGNTKSLSINHSNIGGVLDKMGNPKKALWHFRKSAQLAQSIDYTEGELGALIDLGITFRQMGKVDSALSLHRKVLERLDSLNFPTLQAEALFHIGMDYNRLNEHRKALKYLISSHDLRKRLPNLRQETRLHEALYESHKALGNINKALEHHEKYVELQDSLEEENLLSEITRKDLEYKIQHEKEQNELMLAKERAQSALKDKRIAKQRTERYALFGAIGLVVVVLIVVLYALIVKKRDNKVIRKQKDEVEKNRMILEERNKEITDSIKYAKRIQSAILPPESLIKKHLQDSFVLYKPKDIVAGDFYWMEPHGEQLLIAACDCTGHGVPGAMVSVVCNNGLNRSVREHGFTTPGEILDKTREIVVSEFEKSGSEVKDGMDVALCSLSGRSLQYAGAHNPLWIIRKNSSEVEEIKANKQPIGQFDNPKPYDTHSINLNSGDSVYLFSDGYADQFGGEKGKKFKSTNFKKLLLSIQNEPMDHQLTIIDETFKKWKGDLEQLDDVCVIGFRVSGS